MSSAVTEHAGGALLRVRVKPRSSKSRVLGLREDFVEVAVAAPPVDGEANQELVRTLSAHFGVARSNVRIVRGETAKLKCVQIIGLSARAALAQLAAIDSS